MSSIGLIKGGLKMKKAIEVPKGKNTIGISVSGHSYVKLLMRMA